MLMPTKLFNRFGNGTYAFLDYTFKIPVEDRLLGIEILEKHYIVRTDKNAFQFKSCNKCMQLKEINLFYKHGMSPCRKCKYEVIQAWKKKNVAKVSAHKKKYNSRYVKLVQMGFTRDQIRGKVKW